MTYELRIARQAADYLARLDSVTRRRLLRRLDQIGADPHGPYTKPLINAQGRRASRVGNYRIVFRVDTSARLVEVSAIGPRGDVYRRL